MGNTESRANDSVVDRMVRQDYIVVRRVEHAFRLVDRLQFLPQNQRQFVNLPTRVEGPEFTPGRLHVSAIEVYARVVGHLRIEKGQTFLNVGSGSGYLSTLIGVLLGDTGTNHGIELYQNLIDYSEKRILEWIKSPEASSVGWARPELKAGDINDVVFYQHSIDRYDRIFVGFVIREPHLLWRVIRMLKVGGMLVVPSSDRLCRYTRLTTEVANCEILNPVTFRNCIILNPNRIPPSTPTFDRVPTLCHLARQAVRRELRHEAYNHDVLRGIYKTILIPRGGNSQLVNMREHMARRAQAERERVARERDIREATGRERDRIFADRPPTPPAQGLDEILNNFLNADQNPREIPVVTFVPAPDTNRRRRRPPTTPASPPEDQIVVDDPQQMTLWEQMVTAEQVQRQEQIRAQLGPDPPGGMIIRDGPFQGLLLQDGGEPTGTLPPARRRRRPVTFERHVLTPEQQAAREEEARRREETQRETVNRIFQALTESRSEQAPARNDATEQIRGRLRALQRSADETARHFQELNAAQAEAQRMEESQQETVNRIFQSLTEPRSEQAAPDYSTEPYLEGVRILERTNPETARLRMAQYQEIEALEAEAREIAAERSSREMERMEAETSDPNSRHYIPDDAFGILEPENDAENGETPENLTQTEENPDNSMEIDETSSMFTNTSAIDELQSSVREVEQDLMQMESSPGNEAENGGNPSEICENRQNSAQNGQNAQNSTQNGGNPAQNGQNSQNPAENGENRQDPAQNAQNPVQNAQNPQISAQNGGNQVNRIIFDGTNPIVGSLQSTVTEIGQHVQRLTEERRRQEAIAENRQNSQNPPVQNSRNRRNRRNPIRISDRPHPLMNSAAIDALQEERNRINNLYNPPEASIRAAENAAENVERELREVMESFVPPHRQERNRQLSANTEIEGSGDVGIIRAPENAARNGGTGESTAENPPQVPEMTPARALNLAYQAIPYYPGHPALRDRNITFSRSTTEEEMFSDTTDDDDDDTSLIIPPNPDILDRLIERIRRRADRTQAPAPAPTNVWEDLEGPPLNAIDIANLPRVTRELNYEEQRLENRARWRRQHAARLQRMRARLAENNAEGNASPESSTPDDSSDEVDAAIEAEIRRNRAARQQQHHHQEMPDELQAIQRRLRAIEERRIQRRVQDFRNGRFIRPMMDFGFHGFNPQDPIGGLFQNEHIDVVEGWDDFLGRPAVGAGEDDDNRRGPRFDPLDSASIAWPIDEPFRIPITFGEEPPYTADSGDLSADEALELEAALALERQDDVEMETEEPPLMSRDTSEDEVDPQQPSCSNAPPPRRRKAEKTEKNKKKKKKNEKVVPAKKAPPKKKALTPQQIENARVDALFEERSTREAEAVSLRDQRNMTVAMADNHFQYRIDQLPIPPSLKNYVKFIQKEVLLE